MRGGDRTELGLWGEKQAARYLEHRGYRVLDTRFRCREGEIDLIAAQGPYLCFVEVKLRKDASLAQAGSSSPRPSSERCARLPSAT